MIKIIMIFFISFILFQSCKEPCHDNFITPVFVGFSPKDVDTFIVREYKPNNNFLHLIDTFTVCSCGLQLYITSNDTTYVFMNDTNFDYVIRPEFDWQIYIPSKNRTVRISNIINDQIEGHRGCFNKIESLVLDSQTVIPEYNEYLLKSPDFYYSRYVVFINN